MFTFSVAMNSYKKHEMNATILFFRIKIYDIRSLQDTLQMITVDDEQIIEDINWSDDGQLLAISGGEGNLHVYLTKLPVIGSAYNEKFAYLSSLYEVSICSATNKVKK